MPALTGPRRANLLPAAGVSGLNGGTRHRRIGTKNAAIALKRFQDGAACLAFIKPLTGIRGHGFGFYVAAFGTGKRGPLFYE